MADRRQPFKFPFWRSRRTPATQTPSPPPATTNSTPTVGSQPISHQSTISTTPPPTAETQTPSPPPSTTLDPKTPPPSEMQTAGQPTITTSTSPKDEFKTSSPSTATKSPSSSKPASPSRRTPQSKSPPQPSSPSQARPITSLSPSRNSKPQRASQPRSPSHLTSKQMSSNPPMERQPTSPSKESRQIAQETSTSHETQTSASNPQLKAEVKSDSADNEINGVDETSFKNNEVKEKTSKSTELGNTTPTAQSTKKHIPTENLETSTSNGEHEPLVELKAKHEETKYVKEVVQATKTEANEETKKEVNSFLNSKCGSEGTIIEKSEVPSKPDEVHTEKQEVLERKEVLPTSQLKKRSTSPGTHNKSAQTSGEHVSLNKDIRDDISTFVNQMAIGGDPKNTINDRNVSIITLAGENRGASMQMGSNLKEGPVHIHRGYKINPDESAETTTDGEGSSNGKQLKDATATENQPTETYVNNNAQGINNSIVFNASIAERSPGVHMVVTHVPKEPIRSVEKISPLETRKAEFNMSRGEKLTNEPIVRRRCLRGLLMETSDSDPENPEKPRRHGCRVGCKLKAKENDIDVLGI